MFAYSLREEERGWTWRVYDRNGDVIAAGEALSKALAQGAIHTAYTQPRSAHTYAPVGQE